MSYIYKIINLCNNKIYIGKTSSSIEERFNQHCRDSRKDRNEKRPLYDAMNKYGIENFIIEQIEEVENDEIASEREVFWIDKLRTYIGFEDCNGYNATLGGDSKRYYNYQEIANKYIELQDLKMTCAFFNCDKHTVQKACKECQVKILSSAEVNKRKNSKKVAQIDLQTNEIIMIHDSISDAFRYLKKNKSGGISNVCNGKGKSYLGFGWKFV